MLRTILPLLPNMRLMESTTPGDGALYGQGTFGVARNGSRRGRYMLARDARPRPP